jgi:hypothetical protein
VKDYKRITAIFVTVLAIVITIAQLAEFIMAPNDVNLEKFKHQGERMYFGGLNNNVGIQNRNDQDINNKFFGKEARKKEINN